MWVDTRSVHSDNPGWRDMVSSCFHEWLGTFMIAVRRPCLAMHLQNPYPQKDWEGVVEPLPTRRETEAQELRPPVHPLLARGKVCYTGQPVAVVVAQERYLVRDALAAIQVDYAPLSPVIDPLEAMQAEAVHQELGTNIALRLLTTGGDLDATFAQAEHVVRQRYRVQRLAPAPLETPGGGTHHQPQGGVLHRRA